MNIDTVETVTSQTASTDLDFASVVKNWNTYGEKCWSVNSKNQITCDHDGEYMLSGLLSNENYPQAGSDADVNIKFNQSSAGVMHNGLCFNITQDPEKPWIVSGYFISLSCHNQDPSNTAVNQRVLWKIENWDFLGPWNPYAQSTTECSAYLRTGFEIWRIPGSTKSYYYAADKITTKITCLASWINDGANIDYEVNAKDGKITIDTKQNGKTTRVADVNDGTYKGGTYGFYGTNCEQTQPFAISNLTYSYTQTVTKSLGDIVYEPEWTDGALGLTSGLAEDAAEILERDYDIDAGEVLSMNIDTVETQTSSSEVKASDAETIFGNPDKGIPATWSSYMWYRNYAGTDADDSERIDATNTELEPNQFYDLKEQSGIIREDGSIGTETRVVLTKWGVSNNYFPVFVNTSSYQNSSKLTKAIYKTTFGCDHRIATTTTGECGEAWWFFKLAEDYSEGYALCFDNHGATGCGVFAREWGEVFLVYYNAGGIGNTIRPAANCKVIGKCGIGRWENDPRYDVEVVEEGGKFTVTISPDEKNLSTYYKQDDGTFAYGDPKFTSYTHGNRVNYEDSSRTALPGSNDTEIQWEGATKDPIIFKDIAIADSLMEKNTTQAFQSYKFLGTYFANNSVNVTQNIVKSFGDIVYEPEWTDGALGLTSGLAEDAAEILERDYDIDAGEVLSMNIDTVETITGGIEATSPNFADVVNSWEKYGQETFSAAFSNEQGWVLEDAAGNSVSTLPAVGDPEKGTQDEKTSEELYLVNYTANGASQIREVMDTVPAGKTANQLMSEYGLSGVVFSDVGDGIVNGSGQHSENGVRNPRYGWWGTAIFNPDEYDADNIKASFKVVKGGSLNEGFCFNVTQDLSSPYHPEGQTNYNTNTKKVYTDITAYPISGYFFNVSHHGNSTRHSLFKVKNWKLDNSFSVGWKQGTQWGANLDTANLAIWCSPNANWSTPGKVVKTDDGAEITCLSYWTDDGANDNDYEVECADGRIQIWETDNGTRTQVADVQDSTFAKGTYGFWGNNCEQKGQAQISNLNVEINKTFVKSFGDIVYEPEWTDGALHMLINMDTKADSTMLGSDGGR